MKKPKILFLTLSLNLILMMLIAGCASRHENPVVTADSTVVYLPKKPHDISAKITLCRKISKKTGQPVDAGSIFKIGEKEMVRAYVELENRFVNANKDLMFHLDWLDPDGNSFYLKRIDILPKDSTTVLNSSISISPESRQPGKYLLQVYFFRELIAEKTFNLLPDSGDSALNPQTKISAKITFCKKVDKKTTKRVEIDTVFKIKKNGWVNAAIDLEHRLDFTEKELKFKLDWIGPNDSSIYRKIITLAPGDSTTILNNSISIAPETRQPGKYHLRLYLSGELIAEKKFELIPEPKIIPTTKAKISGKITFCNNVDKTTGERIGVDTVFNIEEKGRIYGFIDLENRFAYADKTLKFNLEWVGPDGKSFYRKQIELLPDDSTSAINSSISVSSETRQPGSYLFRVSLSGEIIASKKFILR